MRPQLGSGDNVIECQVPQAQGNVVVDHSLFSQVGLIASRTGALTAINSTTNTVALNGSGSPVTLSARSQIGGNPR